MIWCFDNKVKWNFQCLQQSVEIRERNTTWITDKKYNPIKENIEMKISSCKTRYFVLGSIIILSQMTWKWTLSMNPSQKRKIELCVSSQFYNDIETTTKQAKKNNFISWKSFFRLSHLGWFEPGAGAPSYPGHDEQNCFLWMSESILLKSQAYIFLMSSPESRQQTQLSIFYCWVQNWKYFLSHKKVTQVCKLLFCFMTLLYD